MKYTFETIEEMQEFARSDDCKPGDIVTVTKPVFNSIAYATTEYEITCGPKDVDGGEFVDFKG